MQCTQINEKNLNITQKNRIGMFIVLSNRNFRYLWVIIKPFFDRPHPPPPPPLRPPDPAEEFIFFALLLEESGIDRMVIFVPELKQRSAPTPRTLAGDVPSVFVSACAAFDFVGDERVFTSSDASALTITSVFVVNAAATSSVTRTETEGLTEEVGVSSLLTDTSIFLTRVSSALIRGSVITGVGGASAFTGVASSLIEVVSVLIDASVLIV